MDGGEKAGAAMGYEFDVDHAREIAEAIFGTRQGMTVGERLEAAGALATAAVYAGDCAKEFAEAWNAAAAGGCVPTWDGVPAEAKTRILVEVGLEHFEADMAAAADRFESRIAPSVVAWREGLGGGGRGGEFPLSRYGASF